MCNNKKNQQKSGDLFLETVKVLSGAIQTRYATDRVITAFETLVTVPTTIERAYCLITLHSNFEILTLHDVGLKCFPDKL